MYPYLVWSVMLGMIWLIFYFLRKDLRHEMLISTILFLPFGLTEPLFVPQYWDPVVLFKLFGLFDVESIMHTAFLGGISSVIYKEFFGFRLRKFKRGKWHAVKIMLSMFIIVPAMVVVWWFTELSVLRFSFIIIVAMTPYFYYVRKDLIKESLLSGAAFMVFYILSLLFIDYFMGSFLAQWNPQGTVGYVLGIPVEEFIYAFLFGMIGSVLYEEATNRKLAKA